MNYKYEVPESITIVRNEFGAVATILFKNSKKDLIISSSSEKKTSIYKMIENYVIGRE